MHRILYCLVIFMFCVQSVCLADTIYLRDGRQVKGKIVEKQGDIIYINVDNTVLTYHRAMITQIEEDKDMEKEVPIVPLETVPQIDKDKRELIKRIMDASGVRDSMTLMFSQLLSQVPPEKRETYRSILNADEILAQIIPIYDEYYTKEELKELLNFYVSPVGQKLIKVTPELMQKSLEKTATYFQSKNELLK